MVHSLAPPMCPQAQHRQVSTVVCFVAPNRQPRAGHRQCLTLTCTRVSPMRPQKPTYLVAGFKLQAVNPKGGFDRLPTLLGRILLCRVSLCTAACTLWLWPVLTVNQPDGRPHSWKCQQQSRLSYSRRAHITYTRDTPGAPGSGERNCAFGPHGTPTTYGHPSKTGRH